MKQSNKRGTLLPAFLAAAIASAFGSAASAESVDEMAARFQQEQGLPGLVVASVAQSKSKGLQMWTGAYGHANIENDEPMTTDTSMWLASLTKAVVGTTMAKAKEQDHLTYETKASDILRQAGAFVLGDKEAMPWLDEITLTHLATHRSTIRDNAAAYMCAYYVGEPAPGEYTLLMDLFGLENACIENSPVTLEGFIESYVSMEGPYYNATTNFLQGAIPGEKAEYSNIAAGLAGYLIELATNVSLPDYTKKELFELLGMKSTSFRGSDLAQVATPYTKLDAEMDEYMEMPIYDLATFPDGGLRSSVNDMAKFLGTIMNNGSLDYNEETNEDGVAVTAKAGGGGPIVLLQPESVQDMLQPRYGADHAIFWFVTNLTIGGQNRNLIGHNGGDPGAFTNLFFDPDTSTGYFLAGNGEGATLDPVALANLAAALFAYADELAQDDNKPMDDSGSSESASSSEPSSTDASDTLTGDSDPYTEDESTSNAFAASPCITTLLAFSSLILVLVAGS